MAVLAGAAGALPGILGRRPWILSALVAVGLAAAAWFVALAKPSDHALSRAARYVLGVAVGGGVVAWWLQIARWDTFFATLLGVASVGVILQFFRKA